MPPTPTTSLRRPRTRPRRFIPTPCIHPEARLLNPDILQILEKASSALSIAHEIAQQDDSTGINQALPQQTHPDKQLGKIAELLERWDSAVETQKEFMRWINGVENEREGEEGSRVCDEVASEWEDLGEVYEGEGGWYIFGEREGGGLMRWGLKRRGVL